MLGLARLVVSLLRVRARACVLLACLASLLCTASIASAQTSAQPKTRVWDFEFASALNIRFNASASPRTHPENRVARTELASDSLLAAEGAGVIGGTTLRAESALQGSLLRQQLAAEEIAGARMPEALTGYSRHALNQAISREGVGVSAGAIRGAFQNPLQIIGEAGGKFHFVGPNATIIVNAEGNIVTTWAESSAGWRMVP